MTAGRYVYQGMIWAIFIFLLAPLVCVVAVSFNETAAPTFPPTAFSLRWYASALSERVFMEGIVTSLWLGIAATLIATPIGTAAAIGLARGDFRGRSMIEALFLAPLIVPGIAIGISLLVAFSAFDIHYSPVKLVAGHVLIVLPYSVRTVLASLARLDPSLEDAARTLGADRRTAFLLITVPLIRPGIVAGMIFAFILSFDDVAVSLFLIDARTGTLPIAIMNYLEYNFDPSIAAISSLLIFATIGLVVVLERLFGVKKLMGA